MNTVVSARDPRWSDQSHSAIVLMVIFSETKELYGEMPFAASPDDSEPYGVELFERAVAGEFGEVQEPTKDMVQAQVMSQRVGLSAVATATINGLAPELETLHDAVRLSAATADQEAAIPAKQAELDAWRLYRVRLAQLDSQADYPLSVDWPEVPAQPFVYVPPAEAASPVQTVGESELPQ